ncbi:MAG: DUF4386 domain-containing protein [Eubacteriales bacterium]|nr:DUF4386 domain-containing protein [Eubacteriales bacterium]
MTIDNRNATLLGVFFIAAAVTAIIAGVINDRTVLSDVWVRSPGGNRLVSFGISMDVLLIISMIGTAAILYPYLKLWNENMAVAYYSFRLLETVFVGIAIAAIIAMLHLNVFDSGDLALTLNATHRTSYAIGANLMLGLSTIIYSSMFLKTGILPKWLAIFGIIAAVLVFIGGTQEVLRFIPPNGSLKVLFSLPIGIFEMTLAVVLISRGFNMEVQNELRNIL